MIFFIVPAYNEEGNLPELLSSLRNWSTSRSEPCQVIAVDDGSADATARILEEFQGLPVKLVRHEVNRGVHEVFRSGFAAWMQLPFSARDWVVTLEADNTSSLAILDAMMAQARKGDDIVLASCYAPGGDVVGTTFFRKFLSYCANLILRCTPGMPRVSTFSSFYRVYRAPFLAHALISYGPRFIEEQGFVCVVEMLLKFAFLKGRISEVPLRLDGTRRNGASKMRVMRTIRGYLALFARAVCGRIARPGIPQPIALTKASGGE